MLTLFYKLSAGVYHFTGILAGNAILLQEVL